MHCRRTLGNDRCQNIRAKDIVTSDKKSCYLLFIFILNTCDLDMHLTVPYKQLKMGPYNDDLTDVWSKSSCKFMFILIRYVS